MSFKIYQVGGSVRDEIMNQKTKDYDFTFCLDEIQNKTVDQGWDEMNAHLTSQGFEIFLATKDCFTIRAKFPKDHKYTGMTADFVMSRREVGYDRGNSRRPEIVLGTLRDDLIRRDFTVNAIAKDSDGKYIDFFDGRAHIKEGMLYTPLDPKETFQDDPLRILRAIRFVITKRFKLSQSILEAMQDKNVVKYFNDLVSDERVREELHKCFKHSTKDSMIAMNIVRVINKDLWENIWSREIWLKPTNEK